jgi:signal transduction histidine kinase
LLYPIDPGEVLSPSPLLSFRSDYLDLHFQMAPDGRLTSPQAPAGGFQILAEEAYLTNEQILTNRATLDQIDSLVTSDELAQCAAVAETENAEGAAVSPPPLVASADTGQAQALRTKQEGARRKGTYQQSVQQSVQQAEEIAQQTRLGPAAGDQPVVVGALAPFWSDGEGTERLVFTRRVTIGKQSYYQGFLCDWPMLRASLLEQIADLFDRASLVPVRGAATFEDESGTMMATIPVSLEVPAPAPARAGLLTPARSTLGLTWLAVVAGMVAVAVTLRASIAFGERRSRFASAVTHELRTPLTTFRMYSEMLADGMVSDGDTRQAYLDTLKDESGRLSNLVENVLAYARLEEGRATIKPVKATVGDVLSRVVPHLRQRAETAGMSLEVDNEAAADTPVAVDVDVVGQILLNLVDNACKYSSGPDVTTVHLRSRVDDGRLALDVRDHGPGVGAEHAAAIFDPFDRGSRSGGDGTPGVGLGLALARGLARDLGGDVVLESSGAEGASFRLTLPIQAR